MTWKGEENPHADTLPIGIRLENVFSMGIDVRGGGEREGGREGGREEGERGERGERRKRERRVRER